MTKASLGARSPGRDPTKRRASETGESVLNACWDAARCEDVGFAS
jgi:hypothetical protein